MLRRGLGICCAVAVALLLPATARSAPGQLSVSGRPRLFPAFDPNVRTYVVRCVPGKPLRLTFDTPARTKVAVDGRKARGGSFNRSIPVSRGESGCFLGTGSRRYLVPCLPSDLPRRRAPKLARP